MTSPYDFGDDTPVYVISVAAQLAGMHPQTLRAYDRTGLVSPGRSAGGGRRYSLRDVVALREVQRLSQEEGVNLSGIKRILELDRELRRHQQHLAELTAELEQLRMELESTRSVAARLAGLLRSRSGGAQLVPVHRAAHPASPPPPSGEQRELPAANTQLNDYSRIPGKRYSGPASEPGPAGPGERSVPGDRTGPAQA